MNPRIDRFPRIASVFVCGAALSGCIIQDHHHDYGYGPGYGGGYTPPVGRSMTIPACPAGTEQAANVTVDTGSQLATEAGQGTGVFVEYKGGGHWHVFTGCDSSITGYTCNYDVTAQVRGATVTNVTGEDLESGDVASSACPDSAYLSVNTGTTFDGMLFDAPAGSPVRVTAALDGTLYADLIYWVAGGVAHSDAHSNPLDLTPSAP